MAYTDIIREKLTIALAPSVLEVEDESAHAWHGSGWFTPRWQTR
jgi:stress-induced morphogen